MMRRGREEGRTLLPVACLCDVEGEMVGEEEGGEENEEEGRARG